MQYDFLILGSGLAGLYSAHLASKYGKVALITKTSLQISNSIRAQGGVAAVIDPNDTVESHVKDTLTAGRNLCHNDAVEILVSEGRERILELIDMDVPFDLEKGEIALGLEGGHSWRRILHAGGDSTGRKIVEFFIDLVTQNRNIEIFENTFVYDLICQDNKCFGAKTFNIKNGTLNSFYAPATFICSGGAAGVYKRTTNPASTTGDGIALAYLAGADVCDLEFIQFHPSALFKEGENANLISEAVRGEGAYLLNHNNERFMKNVHELAELAPRDVVASAIFYEMQKMKKENVFLSLAHLNSKKIRNRFSGINRMLKENGFDLANDLIPISPAAHYTIGGIKTDMNGKTSLNGLYAFGESASTGVHGANRLASNSLLECLVFSKRAIENAKENNEIFNDTVKKDETFFINYDLEKVFYSSKEKLENVMTTNVGIIRNDESLNLALETILEEINVFPAEKNEYYSRLFKMITTNQQLITKAAIKRIETRGGHRRDDYTTENEKLIGNFVFNINKEVNFVGLNE